MLLTVTRQGPLPAGGGGGYPMVNPNVGKALEVAVVSLAVGVCLMARFARE